MRTRVDVNVYAIQRVEGQASSAAAASESSFPHLQTPFFLFQFSKTLIAGFSQPVLSYLWGFGSFGPLAQRLA